MGLRGTGSCDVTVDATVPPHRVHRVAKTGSAVERRSGLPGAVYDGLSSRRDRPRRSGAAQGALDDYVRIQKDRMTIAGTKIAADPSTQIRVAESAADLDAARLSLFRNFADITDAAIRRWRLPG